MIPWMKRNRSLNLEKVGTLNVCVYILSISKKSLINHFFRNKFPWKTWKWEKSGKAITVNIKITLALGFKSSFLLFQFFGKNLGGSKSEKRKEHQSIRIILMNLERWLNWDNFLFRAIKIHLNCVKVSWSLNSRH